MINITNEQYDIILSAIERSKQCPPTSEVGQGFYVVDISELGDALGVQYATARRMLYHAAKKMGFDPTRGGKVAGQGAKLKTVQQQHIENMLAAVSSLMAEYDSTPKCTYVETGYHV